MLKAKPFAHASAILAGGFYLICVLLVVILPDLFRLIGQSWVHSYDLSVLPQAKLDWGLTIFGFINIVVITWITAYVFVMVYNRLVKE